MSLYKSDKALYKENLPSLNIDLGLILAKAFTDQCPLVVWQLPRDTKRHCIVDLSGSAQQVHLDLENSTPGFAVSPFVNQTSGDAFFIKADLYFSQSDQGWQEEELLEGITRTPYKASKWLERFQKPNATSIQQLRSQLSLPPLASTPQSETYEQLVAKGVESIHQGRFEKVVLSRYKPTNYPDLLDIPELFQRLTAKYPTAFCYFFYLPGVGSWMGASPETLISVDQHQIFRTVSLAGTQAYRQQSLSEVAWRQKEIEEQAMVSRYIINCFKKIRLREFEERGPKTVIAGNLLHLCTQFEVDMEATNFPQLGTVMLELLHPTSAVCGMPKAAALDFILKEEHYDRQFYSGFLGPVNIDQASHIFVNLRCMQFLKDQIRLYAGAGITQDSDPSKEWLETELKCETMMRVLAS